MARRLLQRNPELPGATAADPTPAAWRVRKRTRRGAAAGDLVPKNPTPPVRESDHVLDRRHVPLVAIGGVQAPLEVDRVREGEKWRGAPPVPATKSPVHGEEIPRHEGIDHRTGEKRGQEPRPG
jgi:hypothetical protein